MKSKIFLGVFALLIVLGLFYIFPCMIPYIPSKKQILVDQVTAIAIKKITATEDLQPFGTGGRILYEIEMLGLDFLCLKEVDIIKSRELLVYATKTLIDEVNNNEAIHPYLKNYPFTARNVQIDIWIRTPTNEHVPSGKLCYIRERDGLLQYFNQTPDRSISDPFYSETYLEAAKLVNPHFYTESESKMREF